MDSRFSNTSFDLLFEVFKWMQPNDIASSARVCKQWKNVIDSHRFWIFYCKNYGYLDDPELFKRMYKIPIQSLKQLLAKRAFNRNLLDDDYTTSPPTLDIRWSDSLNDRSRSDVFGVEKPPNFLNNVGRRIELDECPVPFESCLVSSFQSARRSIYIDLKEYGLTSEFLKTFKPTIVVKNYYTNRSDCGCRYVFASALLPSDKYTWHSHPDMEEERWWTVDRVMIQQWDDEYWRKTEHVYRDYDPQHTVLCLSVGGSDTQFWAGNYGTKIAGTSVEVKLEFNEANLIKT